MHGHQTGHSRCPCPACSFDPTPPEHPYILVHVEGGRRNWMVPLRESTTAWLSQYIMAHHSFIQALRLEDEDGDVLVGELTEEHLQVWAFPIDSPGMVSWGGCTLG